MPIYSIAARTSGTAIASASQEIIASASAGFRLLELGFTQNTANTSVLGLGKPAAIGGNPTLPVTVMAEDVGNTTAGATTTATAWGTGPTVPPTFYRRLSCPATIGAGSIWTFPRGLTILKAGGSAGTNNLVLWNIAAIGGVLDTWFVTEE
jgi:hypothetical protein